MKNKILHGDVLDILKTLADKSVNTVITSPPYWGLRNYGAEGQIGLEETPEQYVAKMVEVFRELRRALRDDGTCWLNLGDSYATGTRAGRSDYSPSGKVGANRPEAQNSVGRCGTPAGIKTKDLVGIPWMVAFALRQPFLRCNHCDAVVHRSRWGILPATIENDDQLNALMLATAEDRLICPNCFHADGNTIDTPGWYLRSDIIWQKTNPMPESVTDRPTKSHEYIFLLTKRARYWYDADAIREEANYDGRKDTMMKGSDKLKDIPGQTPNSMFTNGTERWPNTSSDGKPGRNKRTVWVVATKPLKDAHFAAFPPKLIKPCILAGCPARVCVECEEPWVRVVEKTGESLAVEERTGHNGKPPQISGNYCEGPTTKSTNTFTPTCQCNAAHRPGVVLDPFIGSGTTAMVAIQNKRDWLGIELNPEYIELAQKRINATQPALFA